MKHGKRDKKGRKRDPEDEALLRTIGKNIIALREAMGWAQQRLAQETGIAQSTMSKTENGTHDVRLSELQRLATALNSTVPVLLQLHEPGLQLVVTMQPGKAERSVTPRMAQG